MLTEQDIKFYADIDFKDFSLRFKSYHNGRRKGLRVSGAFNMSQEALTVLRDETLKRWLQFYEENKDKPIGPWG